MVANEQVPETDSLVLFRNSQGAEGRGTLIRLTRHLVVMEVYNPYSIVQLSEVLDDVAIHRSERTIYSGRAVVNNLVSTGLLVIVSATLVDPWSDLVDLTPGDELRQEVLKFVNDWEETHETLSPGYELSVSKIHHFLEELSRWLERGEAAAKLEGDDCSDELVEQFVSDVDQMVAPKLDNLFGHFDKEATAVPAGQSVIHKTYAQRELHPLLLCSPFLHRSFTKPLGYAGDYEMVNMILRNRWEGSNTYARVVNSYFLRNEVAQAHRNRVDLLTQYLQKESARVAQEGRVFRVLNIGCGPAKEVVQFLKQSNRMGVCELTLVDFNEETLDYAKKQIELNKSASADDVQIRIIHRSIHSLLKEASRQHRDAKGSYDLVYCAGLFDYLSDRICGRLLRLFYDWTRPGGLVVATNVHRCNPIVGVMTHLADWYLVLRDESDFSKLAPKLGTQKVFAEECGVNIFLEIRTPVQPVEQA